MMMRLLPRLVLAMLGLVLSACGRAPLPVKPVQVPAPPIIPAAPPVVATPAQTTTFTEAVAVLEGADSHEIHSPVAGYVIKQAYQEGALVRAGDLLFVIDANREHAQPGAATAETKITSPIAGVAARANSGLGELINPSTTLTVVSVVDPVMAHFTVPQKVYRDHEAWFTQLLAQPMATRPENVRLTLEDGSVYPKLGKLFAIDAHPPTPTDPVTVLALFANPDQALKPGQYARVRLTMDAASPR